MSADNGIYLLQTLDGWRVAHLQAIDNIYWHPTCCDNPDIHEEITQYDEHMNPIDIYYHEKCANCGTCDPEWERRDKINPMIICDYFKDSFVFETEEDALTQADIIYMDIMDDDFCPIVEYGIQKINGLENCPFPTTKEKKDVN